MFEANPVGAASVLTVGAAESEDALTVAPHGAVRRFAGRFALVAFGLYHLPLMLNNYPTFGGGGSRSDGLSAAWGHVFGQVGLWVARHVFQLSGPMPQALGGDNGDTAEEFCRLLVGVIVAALAAAIWTFADRRRPRARWVEEALSILLRYSIALGLASYAIAKIYPVQFGQLPIASLESRVGELSPMGLLWTFMEYSPAYSTVAGAMELAVVLLLCFRRTTLAGALLCLPVMTNVMLVNLCYGVMVKLYAIMIVASALVLVLYDARRVVDALIVRRAVPALPIAPPFRSQRLNEARWLVKLVFVGGVIASSLIEMRGEVAAIAADEASPVYGLWEVESFIAGGRELAQTTEPTRWRRVVIARLAAIRFEDDTLVRCRITVTEAARSLVLTCPRTRQEGRASWTRDGDHLRLEGSFAGAQIAVSLVRRDESKLPLLREHFHWLWDA